MTTAPLHEARAALVRDRVLAGVGVVLDAGEELTFQRVAHAAGVSERTVYRHFPTRDDLMAAVFDWANARIGFEGEQPRDASTMATMIETVFPGFDSIAPVVDALLTTAEGRRARLANIDARRSAAVALVRAEAPGLDDATTIRLAAVVQVLGSATTWQALRDLWDLDGAEAATTVTTALDALLAGARSSSTTTTTTTASTTRSPR